MAFSIAEREDDDILREYINTISWSTFLISGFLIWLLAEFKEKLVIEQWVKDIHLEDAIRFSALQPIQ
jgi:hypothetical protein